MLIILFGLPAAGKNFTGRILQEEYGFHFHDADDDLPPDMREAIRSKEAATPQMRDAHLRNIIRRIHDLQTVHDDIAIAAALFKEKHRLLLREAFPTTLLVWVRATPELLEDRLRSRQNHLADLGYAQKIFSFFEPPLLPHVVLHNTAGREHVMRQLALWIEG